MAEHKVEDAAPVAEYKVGDVARMAGVSVRTLHHYDEVGLLVPTGRTESGYRLYSAEDLRRLQQILFYRELDFELERIAEILAQPGGDVAAHLRRQHRLLRARLTRTQRLIKVIEDELEARQMGISLTPEEQLEVFGSDKLGEYHEEAEGRWGHTDAWKGSQRRTAAYTKEDWIEIKREGDTNLAAFADALNAGAPATGAVARRLADAHRLHISRWFYECSRERHRALAELYVSDGRFAKTFDDVAPGLSQYVHDAIVANSSAPADIGGHRDATRSPRPPADDEGADVEAER